MLDTIIPTSIPYPIRGAIIRAIRTGVAIIVSAVIAYVSSGGLTKDLDFLTPEQGLLLVAVLTPILTAIDKWLREKGIEGDVPDDEALTENVPDDGPEPDPDSGSLTDPADDFVIDENDRPTDGV